jgi:hypothetical protein
VATGAAAASFSVLGPRRIGGAAAAGLLPGGTRGRVFEAALLSTV